MADNPRFTLRLSLSAKGEVEVSDPLVTNELVDESWRALNTLIMDSLDKSDEEVTDEHFREIFIELAYWLILREMSILRLMPIWEENFQWRLKRGKRIQRLPRKKED